MADLSDVSSALVQLAAQALYPNGTGQASAAGVPVKVYPGWPLPQQLDADLRAVSPIAHVSVWPREEERNTTRFPAAWVQQTAPTATITATISGLAVTIGGAMPSPFVAHNVAVLVNGKPYLYAVQASDTLTSVATALAALLAVDWPGTTSGGAVISFDQSRIGVDFIVGVSPISPPAPNVTAARVGTVGALTRELRRQDRQFQLSVWADTPAHRDAVAQPLDVALCAATFLTLTDGTGARIRYRASRVVDLHEKDKIYRRDLIYSVEYATTQTATATQVLTQQLNVTSQNSNQAQIGAVTVNL